ncbi:MAG TPA: trimethylamine methyltransferase family protein [Anaerolineales bacterium]|nr:trimethylamine methyltransferase family protein [Anaerolineales bacterium]
MKLKYLTSNEVLKIHHASLRVLGEIGILLDDPETRTLLADSGARLLDERAYLPPDLIMSCLQGCPREVSLRGRSSEVTLGSGRLHVHNLGGARDVLEEPWSDLRPATSADVAQSARLLDALENVDTVTPLYTPRDVPPHMMILTMFDQTVRNTTKPINGPGVTTAKEVRLLAEMCRVVFGDQPAVSLGASPVSPLNFKGDIAQVMLEIARQNLPFGPLPCPNVGATSPMSLAGSLVQQNAELLASIVIAQLVRPGLPIVYCGRLSVLNMRSGAPIWGNPEVGMLSAGTVQLGHFYGLPVNVYGLAGSGYAADMQSGYERAMNALVPTLAGADELSGVGEMAGGTTSSNAQIVVDNDIYGMVKRILRGFSVDDDSLAVGVIAHAMDTRRNFLGERHTRDYLRRGEIWRGRLGIQEVGWDMWRAAGASSVMDRADRLAREILSEHIVEPLVEEQEQALNEIMRIASRVQ